MAPPASKSKSVDMSKPEDPKAQTARYQKVFERLAASTPEKVRPYIVKVAPLLAQLVVYFQIALPYIVKAVTTISTFIAALPEKILMCCIGLLICFFGGVFPATIAAFEAWNLCGGMEAVENVKILWREATKVKDASAEDDAKDDDGDGIADVDQITGKELVHRKVLLAMRIADPEKFNAAVGGLWLGWVGVLAVLKIQFARTVTLGQSIGDKLFVPVESFFGPVLTKMCPEEYKHWVPVILKWMCKSVAISIAWWIQRILSAFHSSIRGGLLAGRYLVNYLHDMGYIKAKDEDTYMDEVIAWGLAACGLCFQFMCGFTAPFPFNILLLPVNIVEWFIVWSVSS